MTDKLTIISDLKLVDTPTACLKAVFYDPGKNPLFPISAADERGAFYALDYANIRPHLVEIIHSRPHVVRGNHIHEHCTETLTVLSGSLDMYLLCNCPEKHLSKTHMKAGTTVEISPGIAHAVYALEETEITAVFGDGDPREDRERIVLITN
jgi:dTDP-4-dehydrorhamnose 3,5-epimerase-like enzyme